MNRVRTMRVVAVAIVASAMNAAGAQTVLRVKAGAPAGGNGASWATAYNTVEAAIAAAMPGTELWIANGTYTASSANYAFVIPSGVSLYGGFVGTESTRDARDARSFLTILSGASSKTVLAFQHVQNVLVDGFKIINGQGCGRFEFVPPPTGYFHPGGGAQFDGANAVLRNCWFDRNAASWAGGLNSPPFETGEGGAAFVRDSSVVFESCAFTNNRGAEAFTLCQGGHATVYVGPGGGGALSCRNSTVTLVGSTFQANAAGSGWWAFFCQSSGGFATAGTGTSGGAILASGGSLTVDRCVFSMNRAGNGGRAGSFEGGACFSSDAAPGSGGAIRTSAGSANVTNSLFLGNVVPANTPGPCSVGLGGAGGAIYSDSSIVVANCTFVANTATGVNGVGGAISGTIGQAKHCIFWDNLDGTGNPASAQVGATSPSAVSHCIFQSVPPGFGIANTGLNPLFLNPLGPDNTLGTADDRFDLAITSPAIDAGNNSFYTGSALDLAGNTRFFDITTTPDTGSGTAPIIDIGPYERSRCPADLDDGSNTGAQDNAVTIDDLLYFLVAFESGTAAADLDNGNATGVLDNAVTIDDLLFFLTRFEIGC